MVILVNIIGRLKPKLASLSQGELRGQIWGTPRNLEDRPQVEMSRKELRKKKINKINKNRTRK